MAIDINDTPNRIRYTATASQTAFTVPFQFLANADVKVWKNGTLLTLATHYTLTGAGASSGTVTLLSGATLNDDILIVRDMPVQRIGDFPVSGPFSVSGLNNQLDGLTMMARDLETRIERRVLRIGQTDSPESMSDIPVKATRAGKMLAFDASGNPETTVSASDITAAASSASAAAAAAYASAAAAAAAADTASVAAGYKDFATYASLIANTSLTYTAGSSNTVTAGQIIRLRDTNIAYTVLASGASTYHRITAGGVKLNVVPGIRGYNIKAWGAVGDGVTNDSTAITTAANVALTDGIPLYFPTGTYMCNIALTGVPTYNALHWEGEDGATRLKAYSNASNTFQFTTNWLASSTFKSLIFDGNAGTANSAFYAEPGAYNVFKDCSFRNAWMSYRSNMFGNSFSNCDFGVLSSYGYYGYGNSGRYDGWHTFADGCQFRGSKVAYVVDNLSAPVGGDGVGNVHVRSDFQQITGVIFYLRNQSFKPEYWQDCWFEGNTYTGTMDISDLPSPTGSVGTISVPRQNIGVIHSGTSSSSLYKRSRYYATGGFPGATILGDCDIYADRADGPIFKDSATPDAVIMARATEFNAFSPSSDLAVVEYIVDKIEYGNAVGSGTYSGYTIGAQGDPKNFIDYNASNVNRLLCANIDAAGLANGFVLNGGATVAIDYAKGGILGRSYAVTLPAGASVELKGSGSGGSIAGFNTPHGVSFAILQDAYGETTLDMCFPVGGAAPSAFGSIKVRSEWKTYNILAFGQNNRPAIKNSTGSSVTIYLTDLQAFSGIPGSRPAQHFGVVTHLATRKLAGMMTSGQNILPSTAATTAPTFTAGSDAQAQGPILTESVVVTTTAANPSGVTLPAVRAGQRVLVTNKGTNPINIYPATGCAINALGANNPIALAVGSTIEFWGISTTQWYASTELAISKSALTVAGGYLAVTSAAGTTTLTSASAKTVYITGSTTQTVVLPAVTTLQLGWTYEIINANSAGAVTVQSSGLNAFAAQGPGIIAEYECVLLTGTTTASWVQKWTGANAKTGAGSMTFNTQPLIGQLMLTASNAVTAGTNAQGQGALTETINVVTTTAANPSGITLPSPVSATQCRLVTIINKGTNPIAVFPPSGGTIDALTINTAITIPVGGQMEFWNASLTQWYSSTSPVITSLNGIFSSGTAGIGYVTGAGGTVTQITSRTTGVTLSKITGTVTLLSGTTTANTFSTFTVTNTLVAATDTIIVHLVSGATANSYNVSVSAVAAGSFNIQVDNIVAVAVAEAPVIRFTVIKSVSA